MSVAGQLRGSVRRAAYAYGARNRKRKLRFARQHAERYGTRTILVVGVYARSTPTTNQVEQGLLDLDPRLVACGIESDRVSWRRYVVADGCRLPFADQSFDLVYSNAVVEHVGDEQRQRTFLAEHARVGRTWIATTPNRFFPVESHFHGLFTHWRRSWNVEGIRLLSRREFADVLPEGAWISGSALAPTFTASSGQSPG